MKGPCKEIISLQGDIIFLQESHLFKHAPLKPSLKHFSQTFTASVAKKKAGLLIVIKDSFKFQLKSSSIDVNGRFIVLACDINDVSYMLVNVYTPNVKQISFLIKLLKQTAKCHQGHLLIGGDFNTIADPSIDTTANPGGH